MREVRSWKRTICVIAVIALSFLALFLFIKRPIGPRVNVSSKELTLLFGKNVNTLIGPGSFSYAESKKNRAHAKTQFDLFVGNLIIDLKATNAALSELAFGLSYYLNRDVLVVTDSRGLMPNIRFGAFDSGRYSSRYAAARAIATLIEQSNLWKVVRLSDGNYAVLSDSEHSALERRKGQ